MRRWYALSTIVLVVLSLLVGPAGSTPEPAGSARPASYAFLKAQVFTAPGLGAVAVGMPSPRVVKVQHRVEGGTWSRPTVLFHKLGVTCGEIGGRASGGGVALTLECDTPYYEDTAPVHSIGLVTRDLSTWTGRRLPGEAYQDPAISANGQYAAWLSGGDQGDHTLNSAVTGWSQGMSSFDYDSGGEAVVVDDAGTVTVIGPEYADGDQCVLGAHDVTLGGVEDSYVIAGVEPGCTEGMVDNVDDRTVVGGRTRALRYTVTRLPGQRWQLFRRPPVDEPSLVTYGGTHVIRNVFSDAAGQRLVSLGSPDRTQVHAQAYDDATGTWGLPVLVHTQPKGTCTARQYYPFEPLPQMHAVGLRCTGGTRLLTSHDSATWHVTRIGKRPYGISADGTLLAAAGRRSTTVVSPSGTTTLPVSAPGRCDLVFPIAPDAVVRLHGGAGSRWPTRLQKSVAGGRWETIQKVRMPASATCQSVRSDNYEHPTVYFLRGDEQTYVSVRVKRGGPGGWHVERFSV